MYAATKGQLTRAAFMAAGKAHLLSPARRYELGLVDRPHYAFGMRNAAVEASALGLRSITAVEFGVAGGNGLLAMEAHAASVVRLTGVQVRVVGFDSGSGLTESTDYRDLPHLWAPGDFAMDEAALLSRLGRAELVLGDVRETAAAFVADPARPRRDRRIRHPWMLRANVPFQPPWADQMFQAHLFDHPAYTQLIATKSTRGMPLQ